VSRIAACADLPRNRSTFWQRPHLRGLEAFPAGQTGPLICTIPFYIGNDCLTGESFPQLPYLFRERTPTPSRAIPLRTLLIDNSPAHRGLSAPVPLFERAASNPRTVLGPHALADLTPPSVCVVRAALQGGGGGMGSTRRRPVCRTGRGTVPQSGIHFHPARHRDCAELPRGRSAGITHEPLHAPASQRRSSRSSMDQCAADAHRDPGCHRRPPVFNPTGSARRVHCVAANPSGHRSGALAIPPLTAYENTQLGGTPDAASIHGSDYHVICATRLRGGLPRGFQHEITCRGSPTRCLCPNVRTPASRSCQACDGSPGEHRKEKFSGVLIKRVLR
jgi:hypothetical protein